MIKTEKDLVLGYYYRTQGRPECMSLDAWLTLLRDNSVLLPSFIEQHRSDTIEALTKRMLRHPEET